MFFKIPLLNPAFAPTPTHTNCPIQSPPYQNLYRLKALANQMRITFTMRAMIKKIWKGCCMKIMNRRWGWKDKKTHCKRFRKGSWRKIYWKKLSRLVLGSSGTTMSRNSINKGSYQMTFITSSNWTSIQNYWRNKKRASNDKYSKTRNPSTSEPFFKKYFSIDMNSFTWTVRREWKWTQKCI